MINDRWIKLIKQDNVIDVQEAIPGLLFLDAKPNYPNQVNNNLKINGVDGEMPGAITYDPFSLVVKVGFDGVDIMDVDLLEEQLRALLNTRQRYYVVTSQMPTKKYAVDNPTITPEYLGTSSVKFEITFNVFKGYSESLYKTDQFSLMSDKWQFGNGLIPDESISYKHTRQKFKIFNGSSDTINPRFHFLKIWIRANTDKSFKIVNKTTGDVFEFKGTLKKNQSLVLDGVYPYLDLKRCGRITNHGVISLAPGFNDFEVWGSLSNFEIEFVFNYIYR